MKYYYLLFIDAVAALKTNSNYSESGAKFWALTYISMAMTCNLLVLREIIYLLTSCRLQLAIESIGEGKLHSLINLGIYFSLPFLINFILVIRKNKWENVVKKYSYQDNFIIYFTKYTPKSILSELRKKSDKINGMLVFSYFTVSILVLFLYGMSYVILRSLFNW